MHNGVVLYNCRGFSNIIQYICTFFTCPTQQSKHNRDGQLLRLQVLKHLCGTDQQCLLDRQQLSFLLNHTACFVAEIRELLFPLTYHLQKAASLSSMPSWRHPGWTLIEQHVGLVKDPLDPEGPATLPGFLTNAGTIPRQKKICFLARTQSELNSKCT